ncbi:MAG: hypothetical protein GWO87_00965 [Xanthomonadaceae bacterium]|nr:hypothetical protein [Rhodospirillaceae bacterium]NIA17745.1 hypothetical protein [Xanthomonadaceae bacterium]
MTSHLIILIIAIPLLGAFLLPLLNKFGKRIKYFWLATVLGLTDIFSFFLYLLIIEKGEVVYTLGAKFPLLVSPQGFPIRIILEADALSGFLSFIFLSIIFLIFIYSLKILSNYSFLDKFYVLYLLLTVGILGFLFTGDFFTLFVFYEISSITTAGLIAFFRSEECFKSAFHYLSLFAVGSLFLLFGIGILYSEYGFLNMGIIAKVLQFSFLDKVALSLIASSLLLKAGVFPFYFWKPEAYKVSPISAILLSIISSLSAIYILFRIFLGVFGVNLIFGWILILFSIFSIFMGIFLAIKENNIKKILAYLAISELGYIILGISSGIVMLNNDFGFKAIQGGLFHMVNDILDIGLLFLIIGVVIYITKSKNVLEIRGFGHKYPWLAGFFLLGVFAISGMPPLNGFASKIIIYESVFHLSPVLTIIGILGSILILAILIKIFAIIFLGISPEKYQPVPKTAMAVIFVFAILMISIGLFPGQFTSFFINPAAEALVSQQNYICK